MTREERAIRVLWALGEGERARLSRPRIEEVGSGSYLMASGRREG